MKGFYDIGFYGMGVMGSSLAKNAIRHGYETALYSKDAAERERFSADGLSEGAQSYRICRCVQEFVGCLKKPRIIFLMITAGNPVDAVIRELLPLLDKGDVIMDGGNSYYKDTARRCRFCGEKGIEYLGIGVSGGQAGALNGPSLMVGGSHSGWQKAEDILKTISAYHEGKPCCEYFSSGGAGHYVKMVHNGIEYAILELLAEVYQFMRYANEMEIDKIRKTFEEWQEGALSSYLMEISARVLKKKEEDGGFLIDKILDVAEQKGTGKWTIMDAIDRDVYMPSVYDAQSLRAFSTNRDLRRMGFKRFAFSGKQVPKVGTGEIEKALLLGIVIAYSQGFELITKASREERWGIDPAALARVWSNGCIIRSHLLSMIENIPDLNKMPIIFSDSIEEARGFDGAMRNVVSASVWSGIAMPAFSASLQYYDSYRTGKMQVNFIQALRDCFGAHTYQREDQEGQFHTEW